jgi:serine/threonine protein kinase
MPPELFSPSESYSKAVDIWSFGVLVYVMIFGFDLLILFLNL